MISPRSNQAPLSETGISWCDLGVDAGLQGGAAFVVAVPADLFDAICT
jgi:hypothetical protein